MNQAIQQRLDDSFWSRRIASTVIASQTTVEEKINKRNWIVPQSIVAILLFGLVLGMVSVQFFSIEEEALQETSIANYDTTMQGDLLWEKDELNEDYLLLGWNEL
jgi:hypothetical protein